MYHLNAHNFVVTRVFFLSLSPRNFDDQIELKNSPVCYFVNVEIPQVRRLVFDNFSVQCL